MFVWFSYSNQRRRSRPHPSFQRNHKEPEGYLHNQYSEDPITKGPGCSFLIISSDDLRIGERRRAVGISSSGLDGTKERKEAASRQQQLLDFFLIV